MTMIDEKSLEQLLGWAAEEIEVPADGAARIEAAAERLERRAARVARRRPVVTGEGGAGEGDGHRGRIVRLSRSQRVAAVAAAVVAAGLIASAALGLASSSGSSSLQAAQGPAGSAVVHGAARGGADAAEPKNADVPASHQEPRSGGVGLGGAAGAPAPGAPAAGATGAGGPRQDAGSSGIDVAGPRIESTGSMNLTVPHVDPAVAALTSLVDGDGGFVASEQTQSASPGEPASGTVTLQVPQKSFSALVGQVRRVGAASAVSTKAVDVTGQYVDLQAQITALRATQGQYLTIMTKAQSIGDILAVQQQLDSIDSQLQQVEGELHLLDAGTSYGTLTVDLSEPGPKPVAAPKAAKPPTGLAAAWGSARHGFADGVYWVVRQTGGLAFLILLAGLLYLLGRVGWRGLRRLAL